MLDRSQICFVLLPGFAPDYRPVLILQKALERHGYKVIPSNFFGETPIKNFSQLTISQCQNEIARLIGNAAKIHSQVIGIGISLGGALLLEHAKTYDNLAGIISIGTPFRLRYRPLVYLGKLLMPVVYPLWRIIDERYKNLRLPPLGAGPMVVRYLEGEFLNNLEKINAPTLFLHSKKDWVTDYRALSRFSVTLSSHYKRTIFFENGNHVVDHDPERITRYIQEFLYTMEGNHKISQSMDTSELTLEPSPAE